MEQQAPGQPRTAVLFRPFTCGSLRLHNRIVMAPMTRAKSPGGIPGADVAAYYQRRAAGGVGLIMSEGTYIGHPSAGFQPAVPNFHGAAALAGWQRVIDQVHAAGGRMFPQLWHVGLSMPAEDGPPPPHALGPSGVGRSGEQIGAAMTQQQIDEVVHAYGEAAAAAERLGFDGVEIHAAHGYLIDQFFWHKTNLRTDRYGGDLVARTRFAVEVIEQIRRRVPRDYPVCLRFSQWKLGDYAARLAHSPEELEQFLRPLVAAGVDLFHCSQRRFWEAEFPGSDLNLAGWTQRLSGKPAITVGSITLDTEFTTSFASAHSASVTGLDELLRRMERHEFELVAVGRSLIVNPSWAQIVQRGAMAELRSFQRDVLQHLS
ncbi:MAG TPA: NADH:flavin oxidoreductase [Steroidobacteraceae bacterium]|nr:NADH:flavin oxidoreductase [Steroidobacteraceae bacterium]